MQANYRAPATTGGAGMDARMLSTQPTGMLLRALVSVSAALCLRSSAAVQLMWQRHTSRDELGELNEKALNDLGLTRGQVEIETRKWFWQE